MKRLIPLFILIMLVLTSCSAEKAKTSPTLPVVFDNTARVSVGDFSYQCRICKNEQALALTVLSTNATGLKMTYDGSNMNFNYNDLVGDVSADSLPEVNAAKVLFDALKSLYDTDDLKPTITNDGYRYQGSIPIGTFVLITDGGNKLKSFKISSINFSIIFD